jgi:cell division protein FtsN
MEEQNPVAVKGITGREVESRHLGGGLGAFSERNNAQGLQGELDRFMGKGSARVVPATVGSQEVHRVRVGRYGQREEAMAVAQDLAKRGYVVLVVTEYPQ